MGLNGRIIQNQQTLQIVYRKMTFSCLLHKQSPKALTSRQEEATTTLLSVAHTPKFFPQYVYSTNCSFSSRFSCSLIGYDKADALRFLCTWEPLVSFAIRFPHPLPQSFSVVYHLLQAFGKLLVSRRHYYYFWWGRCKKCLKTEQNQFQISNQQAMLKS